MNWMVQFDIAALILCAIIFFVYLSFRRFPSFSNKVYFLLLSFSLISVIGDLATVYLNYMLPYSMRWLNYLSNMLFLAVFNAVPAIYFLFTLSITNREFQSFRQLSPRWIFPYLCSFFLLITTPLTGFIFTVSPADGYQHGPGFLFLYAVTLFYLTVSLYQTLRYHRVLSFLQKASVVFYTVSCIIVVIIQSLLPQYLLTEFAVALSMFFILLTLQNPLEFKDSLTNSFNREAFVQMVGSRISNRKPFTLLCISIEGFPFINEKFGLKNGDSLLIQVADYLNSISPKNCLYHISGTHFVILTDNDDSVPSLIQQIQNRFDQSFQLNSIEVQLWMYLCCLTYPDNVDNLSDLMDTISYSIKEVRQSNTGCIIYGSEEILRKKRRETAVLTAITRAIKTDGFEVYYQPILSVRENRFASAEALIRLKDDELGFIPPDEFIPMAEKNGQIVQIGEIVFRKVCQFLSSSVLSQSFVQSLSCIHVNLSVVQCMQENLAERFFNILTEYQVPSSMINMEITETSAAGTSDLLLQVMQQLNQYGINFSLDDYGTGYSNIANIMKHHYSIVKLDKSIVWAASDNPQAMISLKHTISMMQDLNMSILAEGIETTAQAELLRSLQCDFFQGYLYSRPLPEAEFLQLLNMNGNRLLH